MQFRPKNVALTRSLVTASLLLGGCASSPVDRDSQFRLTPMAGAVRGETVGEREPVQDERIEPTVVVAPGPVAPRSIGQGDLAESESYVPELQGEALRIEANNLPLNVFINEIFGEKLGLSYSLSPQLTGRRDLVTLRLNDVITPTELFRTARAVLAEYGVAIRQVEGIWNFSAAEDVSTEGRPLLVTGETLPEVPISHRPIFQIIELKVVSNTQVRGILAGLFQGKGLVITEDPSRNAIMLRGPAGLVKDASETVSFLDRPLLKGRYSLLIRPAFREATPLADAISDVLAAQGYSIGRPGGSPRAVMLLPMPSLEVIIALANDEQTLGYIEEWATQLDRDYQSEIESGMFIYEVQNTSATDVAALVTQLFEGGGGGGGGGGGSSSDEDGPAPSTGGRAVAEGRLVVDDKRNLLIYRGSGKNWMELESIIKELDKQVPSVLMEVLLAEVTLNNDQGLGIEWLANGSADRFDGVYGTLGGLGVGSRGFSYTLNSAGQTRAVLNAFYDSNQAIIRSSPKIMVKSGEEARIEVGTEIPIITSTRQGDFQTDGNTNVLQQFEFRRTGVTLSVTPVVQASGLVDIRINQTLAETQDTGSGGAFLPTIFNRSVETSLTLRDGGSVVLGGLISESNSQGTQGIPVLGRIPGVGKLFRSESDNKSTTELIIMVVPYVVRNDEEAQQISEELADRLRQAELR